MDKTIKYRDALDQWDQSINFTYDGLQLAALMAIRDELQTLNRVMGCPNVQAGFRALQRIARQHDVAFKRRVEAAVRKRQKRST